ncbi:hypothetical protein [Paraburkholderia hospita]|uniref:hypothetical protein n=1 Tax=Paraburkholderia hospita TaxID=169430 RepID=UPI003ECC89BC
MNVQLYTPDVKVTLTKTIIRNPAAATQAPTSLTLFGAASASSLDGTIANSTVVTAQSNNKSVNLFGQPAIGSPMLFDLNQAIDLTPFLGEAGSVRVSKSVREPAGGFSITLVDKPFENSRGVDSLYGLLEPMDFLEIRIRHNLPSATSGNPATPPILMRGFISEIERDQTMGQDGKPRRTVTISGHDYGKLWQMLQIMFTPGYVIGENILSSFKLFERFGIGFVTVQTAADFVQKTVTAVLGEFLSSLMPANSPNPTKIKFDVSVANGVVDVGGAQNQEGTIYGLLSYFGDVGTFNELYLEDREDGVYCVYRPNPVKDLLNQPIQTDAPNLMPIDVPAADVISLKVSRSDANTANYYWTRAPRFELVSDIERQLFAAVPVQQAESISVDLTRYPNSAEQYYGVRAMRTETQQGGNEVTSMASGKGNAEQDLRDASMANWINNRRAIVAETNCDNVLLESGAARIRANENIRAGCYVRIHQGTFASTFYVPRVDLDFVPYQGLFQTLTLERGTGFVQRMNSGQGTQSPWLQEMAAT